MRPKAREGERLIIMARQDWPRPRFIVSYLHQSGSDVGEGEE